VPNADDECKPELKLNKFKFTLWSVSTAKVHNKLKTACLDNQRHIVYSSEVEKGIIHAYELRSRKPGGFLKASNARFNRMVVDGEMQRLYATTRQGLFLIFDISAVTPLMIHSIKLVVRPDLCSNFAKQIDLDVNKNIVVVKMKNSDVLVI